MSIGKAGRAPGTVFIIAIGTILLLLLLALLLALLIRSGRLLSGQSFGLPASAGLPDPAPVAMQVVPTAAPPQPAEPRQPTEPQPPAPPAVQPTAPPAPISPPVFPSNVEPVPSEGGVDDGSGAPITAAARGDTTTGSVEPYPVGAGSTGSSASAGRSSGGSRVACGVRVVHVVRPGENLFRIALRYNTTIASIARRNGIADARTIRVGQRLTIVTCR